MLIKFKTKLFLMMPILFGQVGFLQASECGVIRYLANKSNGVSIAGNTCGTVDDIAVGSEFNLMPGARLWFKSQTGADMQTTQGICQNRSSAFIRIGVDSNKLPWIKPISLADCGSWANNKINCGDGQVGQNALSCVIAVVDPGQQQTGQEERSSPKISAIDTNAFGKVPERTTSVRMRALPSLDDYHKIESLLDDADRKQQAISAMQPDFGLCKTINPSGLPMTLTWRVETDGQVETVIPILSGFHAQASDAEKPLIDCLTAVIKSQHYPSFSEATWLSSQF